MFSIIIPTYNEATKEKEMKEHLFSIQKYFEKNGHSYEIIVVLDGPTDGKTPQLVKDIAKKIPAIRIIDRKENKGKGYSVREGFANANGEIMLFTDMDGATPIEMFDKFIPEFKNGFDIVIGSRDLENSNVAVHQPKWKEFLGDIGSYLIRFIGGLKEIKDTQCGFKAFSKKAVEDIISRAKIDRWGADFELLIIAKKLGYKIEEVPVEWIDKGDSSVGISGYFSTFQDLLRVRWNLLKNVYKVNNKS
jgi:glycosyltransferase involved in cell wall biosynthesis